MLEIQSIVLYLQYYHEHIVRPTILSKVQCSTYGIINGIIANAYLICRFINIKPLFIRNNPYYYALIINCI